MPFLTPKEEAPLNTCKECIDQPCIKTGKVCKDIEKLLSKLQSDNGYSDRHIRRKEIPYDSIEIENIATQRAMELKYGKRRSKYFLQD